MSPDVRRRALRSTARIVLPCALFGCSTKSTPIVSTAEPAPPQEQSTPAAALPSTASAAPAAVPSPSPSPPAAKRSPSPSQVAASSPSSCEAIVAEALASGAGVQQGPALACCRTLLAAHEARQDPHKWDSKQRGACCSALGMPWSTTCTPWGPPVPPSLRADEAPPRVPALLDLRGQAAALAPTLPAVAHLYEDAQDTWRGRMVNEHESSEVFAALARQIDAARLPPAWSEACRGFADEERRHGVLCGAVLTALGGEALAAGSARAPFPEHDDVAGLEGVVRNVLSVCCLSETVAVALIGAERLQMPDGELRELLTAIYADEVGHARFGWKLIAAVAPSLDADQRARLGDYLAVAFDHLERHELEHLPLATPPPEGAALGLCQGAEARTLFYETVTEVIVPALEAAGLPARVAWAQRGPAAASAMAA